MNKILFETEVGSKMWNMHHAKSDSDRFVGYIVPTKNILKGRVRFIPNVKPDKAEDKSLVAHGNSHFSSSEEIDRSSHELNKIVNEILKNNVNFIWGIFSLIVYKPKIQNTFSETNEEAFFRTFKMRSKNCISQLIFYPINGMAIHNKKKYYDSGKDKGWRRIKTAKTIIRTSDFGTRILKGDGISFAVRKELKIPFEEEDQIEWDSLVDDSLERLINAKDNSNLPKRPTEEAEEELRELLYFTRMEQLEGRI